MGIDISLVEAKDFTKNEQCLVGCITLSVL